MTYVVLARKWRPQRFSDVLGQEHVTQTLTNAIRAQRIAHAFLFSGPRGVGKTSAARILAKALCCEATDGPTAEPCGTCRQCVEITQGSSTDIFEIDAASHTGVDNVRDIIDNARYLPSSARFKIYVIDEVHMLSTPAFNALLKTLEEPPQHVKFVLATTDVHKVPVTVKSRCQRYDFRRIALSRIAERLSFILEQEGIAHDPSALSLVAREAEGSMRDAQSLLEQVLAFAGDTELVPTLVREALGVVDGALVDRARTALLGHDPGDLIELVGDVHARGLDLPRFIGALIEHVRDLLAARLVADPKTVLDRPEDEIATLVAEAGKVSPQSLERLFDQLCRVAEDIGRSSHPRFALEVGLAAIAERPPHVPLDRLVDQLERVEGLLGGSPPSGGRGPSRGPSGGPPSSGPSGRSRGRAPDPQSHDRRPGPAGPPRAGREPGRPSASTPAKSADGSPEPPLPGPRAAPTVSGPPEPPPIEAPRGPPPRRPSPSEPDPAPAWATEDVPFETDPGSSSGPPPSDREPPASQAAIRPVRQTKGPIWLQFEDAFSKFVGQVRSRRPALAATLVQVRPLAFAAGQVVLGCETAFDESKLKDPETAQAIEGLLGDYFGAPTRITVRRGTELPQVEKPKTLLEVEDAHQSEVRRAKEQAARDDPAVKSLVQSLGGAIANIRVLDEG